MRRLIPVLFVLLLALGVAATTSGPALAATFTVDSTIDAVDANPGDGLCATGTGECTLRAAIQETNALTGADIVELPAGTYTIAISGTGEEAAAAGDLDITDDLTIRGSGGDLTIVDAAGLDRALHVHGPAATSISNSTIRGGSEAASGGPYSGAGGGILNSGGSIILSGVVVSRSTAAGGAGIYNTGRLTVEGSRIEENIASAGDGGGINSSAGSVVSLNSSAITGNIAGRDGAGIYAEGSLTIEATKVIGNMANATIGDGGGIFVTETGLAALTDATVRDNVTRGSGGGVFSVGQLRVTDAVVTDNAAQNGNGGGIFVAGGVASLEGTTINANAASLGGGVFSSGTLTLSASEIRNNMAGVGGGVVNGAGIGTAGADLSDTNISGNTASSFGGGIFNGQNSNLTLTGVRISGNTASGRGGGIENEGVLTATNLSVKQNSVGQIGQGGGIENFLGGTLSLASTTISGNTAGEDGGAIQSTFGGSITLTNATISGNKAGRGGGGISKFFGGSVELVNVTLAANEAYVAAAIFDDRKGGSTTLGNTIVSGSGSGGNCSSAVTSAGWNLSTDDTCRLSGPGDIVVAQASLSPLGDNGGLTETHALLSLSPAIDAGDNAGCPPGDQRGLARPTDGDRDGSFVCDIGAYELEGPLAATPSAGATPGPTPAGTPVQLPGTGGQPRAAPGPLGARLPVLLAATCPPLAALGRGSSGVAGRKGSPQLRSP